MTMTRLAKSIATSWVDRVAALLGNTPSSIARASYLDGRTLSHF